MSFMTGQRTIDEIVREHWRVDPEEVDRWKAGRVLKPCVDAEL